MDVISVKVNPANGDDKAAIYAGPLQDNISAAENTQLGTVDKGEILKVVSKGSAFTEVAVTPTGTNEPKGGSSDEGICLANPYTYLYNNIRKQKPIGRVNNGTWIKILELNDRGIYKVRCITTNGTLTGYLESRFIFRKCLDVPSEDD